jgi:hypothetical protein
MRDWRRQKHGLLALEHVSTVVVFRELKQSSLWAINMAKPAGSTVGVVPGQRIVAGPHGLVNHATYDERASRYEFGARPVPAILSQINDLTAPKVVMGFEPRTVWERKAFRGCTGNI